LIISFLNTFRIYALFIDTCFFLERTKIKVGKGGGKTNFQ
jgi:hypothetical protein